MVRRGGGGGGGGGGALGLAHLAETLIAIHLSYKARGLQGAGRRAQVVIVKLRTSRAILRAAGLFLGREAPQKKAR